MNTIKCILLLTVEVTLGMFFHEPSFITIKPSEDNNGTDFGFSIGYQSSGKLVIGAPHADLNGRVYICQIDDIKNNITVCASANIDVELLTQYSNREPNQCYNLGASIAATRDYFLTCAPLWMSSYKNINPEKFKDLGTGAYGTCFIYDETAHRYNGTYEQMVEFNKNTNRQSFSGGIGWTTLMDEINDLILIAKIQTKSDISYISRTSPLSPVSSMLDQKRYYPSAKGINRYIGFSLASGKFSMSGENLTVYAVSLEKNDLSNSVIFLKYEKAARSTVMILSMARTKLELLHETINSMFGAAMTSDDLNRDGYSELLVGAPAQGDDNDCPEVGAVYIFTGGELGTINEPQRKRAIIGTKEGSRFGSAFASTDIDGDHFPEVVISAPYEDLGAGAVYIISGSELNRLLLKGESYKSVSLSQLVSTQRIQNKDFKSFGFSLQVIKDINENGCDELAVGCPDSGRVLLYRSIPPVKLAISTQLVDEQVVRITAKKFKVRVIIDVSYPARPKTIVGKIKLMNSIIGQGVKIANDQHTLNIDLSSKEPQYVTDVDVSIDNFQPGSYKFSAVVESASDDIFNTKNFNPSWIRLEPKTLTSFLVIERHCSGESCLPNLNMTLEWSGSTPYTLGSTKSETVFLHFKNHGNSSYVQTCAYVTVKGALVASTNCTETDGYYNYLLPVPMKRNEEHTTQIILDMKKATNEDKELVVDVTFYYNGCSLKSDFRTSNLTVPFEVNTDKIKISGESHERVITDRELMDETLKVVDAHEYTIVNRGNILWKHVSAIITWKDYSFIESYNVTVVPTISNCRKLNSRNNVEFLCKFNLEPQFLVKIIATSGILGTDVEKSLTKGRVNMTSSLQLYLAKNDTKTLSLTTFIQYQKVLSWTQNKLLIILIAFIVAIIITAVVAFILYKFGFFNRNTKKQLIQEKKEYEIRKSMRRPAIPEKEDTNGDQSNTNDIEVMDDH